MTADHKLVDGLPTGVVVSDAVGVILYANPRAAEILGRPLGQLLVSRVEDVFAPIGELIRLSGSDASLGAELPPRPNGGPAIGFRLGKIDRGGSEDEVQYGLVFQDLGPIQRLREERDRLLQLAAVGEVLPGILHEIKNPVAGITTAVEVLLEEVPEGHIRRELLAVLGEVRRITLTLEGIGLFRHQVQVRRHAPVHKALREALLVVEPQMRAKGIRSLPRIPDLPPLPLDAAIMRALLFNLVTNSIHACGAGCEVAVSLRLVDESGELELSVADTGCGMAPAVLARCRDLFFTTKPNGSGIGLALCARTVEESGGRMDIVSQEGSGTTVTLRLPVRADHVSPMRRPTAS